MGRLVKATACIVLGTALGARAALGECEPWPGEFDPLPTVTDTDFLRAQWARTRARELTDVATRLETGDPAEAQRLWLHARCIAPHDGRIARGLERATGAATRPAEARPPVAPARAPAAPLPPAPAPATFQTAAALSSRPPPESPAVAAAPPPQAEVAPVAPVAPPESVTLASPAPASLALAEAAPSERRPTEAIAAPASVAAPPPAPDPCRTGAESCPKLRDVDRSLAKAESLLRSAHFDESMRAQKRARALLDALPASSATRSRRVRLELAAATTHVAQGKQGDAEVCLARALRAEPSLQLDPSTTSPKLMRALDGARHQGDGALR